MTVLVPGSLREEIEQIRGFFADNATGFFLHDLVLEQGREFVSVPWRTWRGRGYRRGLEAQCFRNAERLACSFPNRLIYVEGMATTGLLPVHHAWCVEEDGRVVDPTWREIPEPRAPAETWEYLGLPLDIEWVEEQTTRRGCYSVFADGPVDDVTDGLRSLP